MNIVHISAELSPIAKVGGLAEAVYGMLHSSSKVENLTVILPFYNSINPKMIKSLRLELSFFIPLENSKRSVKVFKGKINNFSVVLIQNDGYFGGKNIYGYKNDHLRFLFFSKAALQYLNLTKAKIDILHIHDWHASGALPLYQELYQEKEIQIKKTVLSIHNLCYQGVLKRKDLNLFGIKKILPPLKGENSPDYNLLKGGITLADKVIAVSPTYAKEIQQRENSFNLYKTIKECKSKITGLLNGIDISVWNPKIDPFLTKNYSNKMSFKAISSAKTQNKKALYKKLGLTNNALPLIAYIGRLTEQKGLELIEEAIVRAKKGNYRFILLGSSNEPSVQKHFEKLQKETAKEENISLHLEFNEELSHQIYASSDFMIIPSIFEPCGLVQLIAFHYGTIPIARKTGGLKDTICNNVNGILFTQYSKTAFNRALNKALAQYRKKSHEKMLLKAFAQNYCWSARIKDYLTSYRNLLKK